MELRTTFRIEPSKDKITYNDPVMFIGSCFASSMGAQMAVGRMPTTGIPLPLMSYGGSSMLSVFAMLGLVNSVRLRHFGS